MLSDNKSVREYITISCTLIITEHTIYVQVPYKSMVYRRIAYGKRRDAS